MRIPDLTIYEDLPDNTKLRPREVLRVYKYKGGDASCYVSQGLIPKPTIKIDKSSTYTGYGRRTPIKGMLYWTLGDLRKVASELTLINEVKEL
jgi:hypothetical protein